MRVYLSFTICFFVAGLLSAQDFTVLQVVGFCGSAKDSDEYQLTLQFSENKNQCDPATGFVSIENQKVHFEESLGLKNISFSDFKIDIAHSIKKNSKYTGIEAYTYITKDSSEVSYITKIAQQQFVEITNVGFPRRLSDLASQDEAAICALKDATERAELLSKHLGYENCQLVSVDDETSIMNTTAMRILLESFRADTRAGKRVKYPSTYSIIGNYKMY